MSSNLTQQRKPQFELNNSSGTIAQLQEEIMHLRTDVKHLQSQNAMFKQIIAAYQCKSAECGNGGLDVVQIVMPEGHQQTDDGDHMDEDMDILTECLKMIKQQKTEISQLKTIIFSEKAFLENAEILAGKKMTQLNAGIREEATGSSFHQFAEETPLTLGSHFPTSISTYAENQLTRSHSALSSKQNMLENINIVGNSGIMAGGLRMPGVNQSLKQNTNQKARNLLTKGVKDLAIERQSASNIDRIANVNSQNSEIDRDLNVANNMIFTGNIKIESRNVVNQKPFNFHISPGRTVLENEAPIDLNSASAQVHQSQMLAPNLPKSQILFPNLPNVGLPPNLHYSENRPPSSQQINEMTGKELMHIHEPTDDPVNSQPVQSPKEIFIRKHNEPINKSTYENFAHSPLSDSRNNDYTEIKSDVNFGCFASNTDTRNNTESELTISQMDLYANQPNLIGGQPIQEQGVYENPSALKICPACNLEFSYMSMTDFQQHVCECFEQCDEPPETLLAVDDDQTETQLAMDDDQICPMCQATFPLTVPHETYEQHVLAHFNDETMSGNQANV